MKPPRRNDKSIFFVGEDHVELLRKTKTIATILHLFQPEKTTDLLNLWKNEASIDQTPVEFKNSNSLTRQRKYRPSTTNMVKNKNKRRCLFVLAKTSFP